VFDCVLDELGDRVHDVGDVVGSAPSSDSHSRSRARTARAPWIVASTVIRSGGVGVRRCAASSVTSSL